jgi:hyperosmotically inducible protein
VNAAQLAERQALVERASIARLHLRREFRLVRVAVAEKTSQRRFAVTRFVLATAWSLGAFFLARVRNRTDATRGKPQAGILNRRTTMKTIQTVSTFLAALVAAAALGCASSPRSEGTGEYVDDTVVTAKVKTAIFEQPSLKSAEINVETFKGVVQLSGFVSSQANVDSAVMVAKNVAGVKSVKNDMRVK